MEYRKKSLADSATATRLSDRRKDPRWLCIADIAIMPVGSDAGFIDAQVTNYSVHGLAMRVPKQLRTGERIIVKVKLTRPVLFIYTVRNCISAGEHYQVGAEYGGVLGAAEDDADALHDQFVEQLNAAAGAVVR